MQFSQANVLIRFFLYPGLVPLLDDAILSFDVIHEAICHIGFLIISPLPELAQCPIDLATLILGEEQHFVSTFDE